MISSINRFIDFFFLCKKDKFLLLSQGQKRQKMAKMHIGSPGYLDWHKHLLLLDSVRQQVKCS